MSDTGQKLVRFWKPVEDDAVLCSDCGLRELNATPAVMLGLKPPYATMDEGAAFLDSPESRTVLGDRMPIAPDVPYFTVNETGTCADCGVTR